MAKSITRMGSNHEVQPIAMQSVEARAILERKIETGRAAAVQVFERINQEAPKDAVSKGKALDFAFVNHALEVSMKGVGGLSIHHHALGQIAERAGVPMQYLSGLVGSTDPWKRELAVEVLSRHYHAGEPNTRYLVRAVKGQVRGFLSNKFRRLDSRPLVDAFAQECQKIGAVPVDGTCSDTRVTMKAPVPGEVMAFGLEWGNSDFGAALHSIRAFILRLRCLNGATMENALAQVHIGRAMSEDIELSDRTYKLDTQASVSALRDVVAGTLSEKKIAALCDGIANADAKEIEWRSVSSKLQKKLLKGELDEARKAFEGDDVVMLPPGKSMWRASNALSWLAGKAEDPDRKMELQRLAGEVIGKADSLAEAA